MSLPANWSSRLLLTALSFMLPEAPLLGQKIRRIGAEVYAKNCASIYCHGAQGTAGAAPAVAGKGLSLEQLNPIVREGVPDTAMAGWKDVLSASDLAAVIEYVSSIQETLRSRREELDPNRPWLTHAGRELFFDPNRITPCGSCHELRWTWLGCSSAFQGRAVAERRRAAHPEVGQGENDPASGPRAVRRHRGAVERGCSALVRLEREVAGAANIREISGAKRAGKFVVPRRCDQRLQRCGVGEGSGVCKGSACRAGSMTAEHVIERLEVRKWSGAEIRTPDLLLPKQARYQAALRPDSFDHIKKIRADSRSRR